MFNVFQKPTATQQIRCYVRIAGKLSIYGVETNDVQEARRSVISAVSEGFKPHGVVLALVPR